MKISKEQLLQIIKEEIEDATKIKSGSIGTSASKQSAIQRAASTKDMSAQERAIVDQIQNFVTGLANTEGVDLVRYKPALERALKYMRNIIGADNKQAGEEQ
jgi:RNA polymerase-interacting CarD/CdnL/TRCF family regulator